MEIQRENKIGKSTLLTITLITSSLLAATLVGCSSDDDKKSDETAVTTTQKVEETTTEEITTEEPTEYVYKGKVILIEKKNVERFNDLKVESGYTFYINDFCSNSEGDDRRGNTAYKLLRQLGMDTAQFEEKYFPLGYQAPEIPYEDNYSFTYTGDKKFIFTFVKDGDYEYSYFDFYEIE